MSGKNIQVITRIFLHGKHLKLRVSYKKTCITCIQLEKHGCVPVREGQMKHIVNTFWQGFCLSLVQELYVNVILHFSNTHSRPH